MRTLIKLMLRLLGLLERVQGHTRMGGVVKVTAYWRRS